MKRRFGVLIVIIFSLVPILASAQSRLQINREVGILQNPTGSEKDVVLPKSSKGLTIAPEPKLLPGEKLRLEPYSAPRPSPAPQATPLPPPSTVLPEKGAYNPRTGESYPGVLGGAINPQTGDFLPRQNGGYVNPRTGEFLPSK